VAVACLDAAVSGQAKEHNARLINIALLQFLVKSLEIVYHSIV
jgi:hypothetical protein